jgi:hypothetical protein
MRVKIGWIVAALMVVGGSIGTQELTAQPIIPCGECSLGPTGEHDFVGNGDVVTCESWAPGCYDACHSWSVEGNCFSTHYEYCSEEDDDSDLLVALRHGDRAEILKAVLASYEAGSGDVKLLPERKVLQVQDCVGLVVAQVPLPAKPEPRLR